MGGFGFCMGVGGVRGGSSNGDGIWQRHTVSGGTGGGVGGRGRAGNSVWREKGQSAAARAAE